MKGAREGGWAKIVKKNGRSKIVQGQGSSGSLKQEQVVNATQSLRERLSKDQEQRRSVGDLGSESPQRCKDSQVRRQDGSSEGGKGRRRKDFRESSRVEGRSFFVLVWFLG